MMDGYEQRVGAQPQRRYEASSAVSGVHYRPTQTPLSVPPTAVSRVRSQPRRAAATQPAVWTPPRAPQPVPVSPSTMIYEPNDPQSVTADPSPPTPTMAGVLMMVGAVIAVLMFGLILGAERPSAAETAPAAAAAVAAPAVNDAAVENRNEAAITTAPAANGIAAFFAPSVRHWEAQIIDWAADFDLDPNMVATVMQIESCGDPAAVSSAGAQGLFQVMPFHFTDGEQMQDPDTNARRGMAYLRDRLIQTAGDSGRAFAGYNGGHVAAGGPWENWPDETKRYYRWSTGIYAEAQQGMVASETLTEWMAAGGRSLCAQAEQRLGLR